MPAGSAGGGPTVGSSVGAGVGAIVGSGVSVGVGVGAGVGDGVGTAVGDGDGDGVGDRLGEAVGARVASDGDTVGWTVGGSVGDAIGVGVAPGPPLASTSTPSATTIRTTTSATTPSSQGWRLRGPPLDAPAWPEIGGGGGAAWRLGGMPTTGSGTVLSPLLAAAREAAEIPSVCLDALERIDEAGDVETPARVGELEGVAPRQVLDRVRKVAGAGHFRVLDQHGNDPWRSCERVLDLDAQVVVGIVEATDPFPFQAAATAGR